MQYKRFIDVVKQHQTLHIKAVNFSESCAPNKIPDSFASLLPDIIQLLEKQIQQFCEKTNQILVLFGLQPGSIPISSNKPFRLRRVFSTQHPTSHLCCNLSYLVTSKNEFNSITSWEGAQTIIVDFTTGQIMDSQRYLSLVLKKPLAGISYGNLSSRKLTKAWVMTNRFKQARAMEMALAA